MRTLYLHTAAVAAKLLREPALGQRWNEQSVLPGFKVSGLAGHLARSVLQVEWYLDAAVGDGQPVTAAHYYHGLVGLIDPESDVNRSVRQRGEEEAVGGQPVLVERTIAALGRLRGRLPGEAIDRRVEALGRVLLLDDYLKTRLVELTVHMDDLAISGGLPTPHEPAAAYRVAVETLVDVATLRSGVVTVLRALSRGERQDPAVLRVL